MKPTFAVLGASCAPAANNAMVLAKATIIQTAKTFFIHTSCMVALDIG
jgi:hypothetical protein